MFYILSLINIFYNSIIKTIIAITLIAQPYKYNYMPNPFLNK